MLHNSKSWEDQSSATRSAREGLSRRKFLEMAVLASCLCPATAELGIAFGKRKAKRFKVLPASDFKYSPSFLRFSRRATFDSFDNAVRGVLDKTIPFTVMVLQSETLLH